MWHDNEFWVCVCLKKTKAHQLEREYTCRAPADGGVFKISVAVQKYEKWISAPSLNCLVNCKFEADCKWHEVIAR